MIRMLTAGESHGPGLTIIVEGFPAGVPITTEAIDRDLKRRQGGHGRGGRMRIETDTSVVRSGVRHARSTGTPIAITIDNRDHAAWEPAMRPGPLKPGEEAPDIGVYQPRPGHADLAGSEKLLMRDARDVLERASARTTAARVAAGTLAKALLSRCGISVLGHVVAVENVQTTGTSLADLAVLAEASEASPVRCADAQSSLAMVRAIDQAAEAGDSLGGWVEVLADGVPPGLGHFAEWDRRLDGRLARALMSVPAVKALEVGDGISAASQRGSRVHDPITYDAEARRYRRPSNHAGGFEGGMSNGERLVIRAAMKPIPTLARPLASVDLRTHETVNAAKERTDTCAVPACAVVCEAVVAWELAAALLERFGGETMREVEANVQRFRTDLEAL